MTARDHNPRGIVSCAFDGGSGKHYHAIVPDARLGDQVRVSGWSTDATVVAFGPSPTHAASPRVGTVVRRSSNAHEGAFKRACLKAFYNDEIEDPAMPTNHTDTEKLARCTEGMKFEDAIAAHEKAVASLKAERKARRKAERKAAKARAERDRVLKLAADTLEDIAADRNAPASDRIAAAIELRVIATGRRI